MSVPEGTRPRWPLRSAGLVLLGLAAASALIGLVLVASGDGEPAANGRVPASSDQAPGSASARPSATPSPSPTQPRPSSPPPAAPPVPASPVPASPVPASPAPGGPGPAAPARGFDSDVVHSGKGDRRGEARVYNNSTIHGLATRAADDLTAAGWTVVEVANYPGGRIPTSTVYYQEGTDQRATAEAIGAEFGMRVEPRFAGIANARPGVIVIVTNDYGT
ncbi:MAG: LytR C-terminal domain-containing protein [Pseudonocardiaceae bacterium]